MIRRMLGIALFGAAVLAPIAVLPAITAWSVDPLARAGARILGDLRASLPIARPDRPPAVEAPLFFVEAPGSDFPNAADVTPARPRRAAPVPPRRRAERPPGDAPPRSSEQRIFVSPEMIRRAVPSSGRPAAVWTARSGSHPAGVAITSAGALAGIVGPGDILCEAEGQMLGSMDQLVSIVTGSYQRGAKYLSGRLWRGGELVSITVEPGWITEATVVGR